MIAGYSDIDNAAFFYLVKVNESPERYRISMLSKDTVEHLDKLQADPETKTKHYWLIPQASITKITEEENLRSELFRPLDKDNDIDLLPEIYQNTDLSTILIFKTSPFDEQIIKSLFDFNPGQCKPDIFDAETNKKFSDLNRNLHSNDESQIIRTLNDFRSYIEDAYETSRTNNIKIISPLLVSCILPALITLFYSENARIKDLAIAIFNTLTVSSNYWNFCDKNKLQEIILASLTFVASSKLSREDLIVARQVLRDYDDLQTEAENIMHNSILERIDDTVQRHINTISLLNWLCTLAINSLIDNFRTVFQHQECVSLFVQCLQNTSGEAQELLIESMCFLAEENTTFQNMFREANGLTILVSKLSSCYSQNELLEAALCVELLGTLCMHNDANSKSIDENTVIPLLIDCTQSQNEKLIKQAGQTLKIIASVNEDAKNLLKQSVPFITPLFERMHSKNNDLQIDALKTLKLIYENDHSLKNTVFERFLKNYDEILVAIGDENDLLTTLVEHIQVNIIRLSKHQISTELFMQNIDNIQSELDHKTSSYNTSASSNNEKKYQLIIALIKQKIMQLINAIKHPEQTKVSSASMQDILQAKKRLNQCGALGEAVIAEILCLERGNHSPWSAIWAGSEEKLTAIVTAVNALPKEISTEGLNTVLIEERSILSESLFTVLGRSGDAASAADAKTLTDIQTMLDQFQTLNKMNR